MKPLVFVIFQLLVLAIAFVAHVGRGRSPVYRLLWLASLGGVVGMDVWYLVNFAYPAGFKVWH